MEQKAYFNIRENLNSRFVRKCVSTDNHTISSKVLSTYVDLISLREGKMALRWSKSRTFYMLLTCKLIYLLTYLLTPWSTVLLQKLTSSQPVKKFSENFGTRRFITVLTSAHHLSLSLARSIQSMSPHSTSLGSLLILAPPHLLLGLRSCLFASSFPTKTLYAPLLSSPHMCYMPHLSYSSQIFSVSTPVMFYTQVEMQLSEIKFSCALGYTSISSGPSIRKTHHVQYLASYSWKWARPPCAEEINICSGRNVLIFKSPHWSLGLYSPTLNGYRCSVAGVRRPGRDVYTHPIQFSR